jgi:hypothetical protein
VTCLSNAGRLHAALLAAALLMLLPCAPALGQRGGRGGAPPPRYSPPNQRNGGFDNGIPANRGDGNRNYGNQGGGNRGYQNRGGEDPSFRKWQRNWEAQQRRQERAAQRNRAAGRQQESPRAGGEKTPTGFRGQGNDLNYPASGRRQEPQDYPEPTRTRPAFPGGAQRPPYRPGPEGAGNGASAPRPHGYRGVVNGPGHLPQWLNQHRGMNVQQQERLLRNDPTFKKLPPGDQRRLMQQLQRVDRMSPAERQRRLERNEMIERLSPEQQMQVNRSMKQFQELPAERRAVVGQAFRQLQSVPADQRQTELNSARYQNLFSPEERGILSNLLKVEPYQPPQ